MYRKSNDGHYYHVREDGSILHVKVDPNPVINVLRSQWKHYESKGSILSNQEEFNNALTKAVRKSGFQFTVTNEFDELKEGNQKIQELLQRLLHSDPSSNAQTNQDSPKKGWYENESGGFSHSAGYGITLSLSWVKTQNWMDYGINGTWAPATPKEVKEALKKVAEKMGYRDGVKIEPLVANSAIYITSPGDGAYNEITDTLWLGGAAVYRQGQWAEIISEPKLTLGGYEVEVDKAEFKINGFWYDVTDIELFSKATKEEYDALKKALLKQIAIAKASSDRGSAASSS